MLRAADTIRENIGEGNRTRRAREDKRYRRQALRAKANHPSGHRSESHAIREAVRGVLQDQEDSLRAGSQ